MNATRFSFLFFFSAILMSGLKVYSQQKDSTSYYYNKMLHPTQNTDIPLAIKYYTAQTEKYLVTNNNYEAIKALRIIAIGQFEIGNIYDSESAAVKAIAIIENSPQTDTLIESRKGFYNQLGKIYRASEQPKKAIEAYDLALRFSKTIADSLTIINNKATIYKDSKKYLKALELLELALNKKNSQQYPEQFARILDNLGYVQFKLNKPNALYNLNKALQIRDSLNDLMGRYSSNKSLALYYLDKGKKQRALSYINSANNIAQSINSPMYLEDALSLYIFMADDPKIKQYLSLSDSIAKQKQLAENKNAFIKYNVEKEQKNTAAAQLQQEKERGQKLLYMALGIFASVLSIFIILLLKVRHKKEKIIQVHNTESRISKKVHDEVANDVYHLMAKIQGNQNENESLLDDLEKIYNKTRDISKENSAIEIEADFSAQLNDLLLNYQNEKTTIATRNISKIEWESISEIKKTTIYRVLQELMTNMKKHSQATAVGLVFQQTAKKITINYTDNGTGCSLKNKNGLLNAENRIHAINGTITFDSEPGKGFRSKIMI